MSVSDNSDLDTPRCDLDELIEAALSAGSKAPDELLKAVMEKAQVNERTYYRHLEKLLDIRVVEEFSEKANDGRITKKYALKASAFPAATISPLFKASLVYEDIPPSRRYLELAAWLQREPEEWPPFEAVRKSRCVMNNYAYLVPAIEASREDPDRYAFVWSDEPCYGRREGEFVQSRFFRLKDVYMAVVQDPLSELAVDCKSAFLGAYGSEVAAEQVAVYGNMRTQIENMHKPMDLQIVEQPFSVCIGVCKEANNALRVVYVEGRTGKLDKAWVKGVSAQLGAKAQSMVSWDGLKENVKRAVLLKLRNIIEKHALMVPNRYVKIVEELLDYSYKNPSSGYTHALALAVDLASPQG